MSVGNLILYLIIAVLFTAAFSAIFTFIAMMSSNKTTSVVISGVLFFGLLLLSSYFYNALAEPEMTNHVYVTANGLDMGEPVPNPNYVSGFKRTVYDFLLDLLSTGQAIRMAFLEIVHPLRMILSSIIITIFVTACGIALFRKKDLN